MEGVNAVGGGPSYHVVTLRLSDGFSIRKIVPKSLDNGVDGILHSCIRGTTLRSVIKNCHRSIIVPSISPSIPHHHFNIAS